VRGIIDPLLAIFEFYGVNSDILDNIIEAYVLDEVR
jgi:hypothetical protein